MSDSETRGDSRVRRPHSWWHWAVAGYIPGFVGGNLFAALFFFLNPLLPFGPGPVARTLVYHGLIGGFVSMAMHLLLIGARRLDPWRFLPWTLTIVLAGSALLDWVHASQFSFYLPPGINNRLIKAALWVSLTALIAFYTALLHTLQQRRYSVRSRALMVICGVLAVVLTVERRAAYREGGPGGSRASFLPLRETFNLLVVGIDGASLEAILPLAEQGQLPFLSNLLQQGAYGRLRTVDPVDPVPVWFSVATGRYPYRHGVVSDRSYRAPYIGDETRLHLLPVGLGMRHWAPLLGSTPTTGRPRPRSPAIWDFLGRSGHRTAAIGWPAHSSALETFDLVVSNAFFRGTLSADGDRPDALRSRASELRIEPDSIDPSLYASFGVELPAAVRNGLAQDVWREAVARDVIETGVADVVFVHLPGLQAAEERYFGGYSARQFDGAQSEAIDAAAQIVTTYYSHLDQSLQTLWSRLPAPRLLVVVSAWGADEPPAWRQFAGTISGRDRPVTGRFETAPDGIVMLLGDRLRSGTFLDGAEIIDVAPTLLYGLGLPVSSALEGKVLTESFSASFLNDTPLTFVPAYKRIAEVD